MEQAGWTHFFLLTLLVIQLATCIEDGNTNKSPDKYMASII